VQVTVTTAQRRRGAHLSPGGRQFSFITGKRKLKMFGRKPTPAPLTQADIAVQLGQAVSWAAGIAQQQGMSTRAIADKLEAIAEGWDQAATMSAPSTAMGNSVEKLAAIVGGRTR
jgi:hypothetical protein